MGFLDRVVPLLELGFLIWVFPDVRRVGRHWQELWKGQAQ